MTYYGYAAASALFLFGLTGALLPFLSVWDRHSAVIRKRSLYDKSAGQVESLAALVQIVYAVLLGADLLWGGTIDACMIGPWSLLWEVLVMSSAVAALCATVVLLAPIRLKKVAGVFSGLFALMGQTMACVLMWAFCLGALTGPDTTSEVANQAFVVVLDRQYWPQLGLFTLLAVLGAMAGAYGLSLCWHILCRKKDDFGRDFYSFVLGMRSRQATWSGILLLPVSVAVFLIYPLDPVRAQDLLPLFQGYAEVALSSGMLALPVSVMLWYAMSRAPMPMQRRSLAFLALLFFFAGMYSTLGRF